MRATLEWQAGLLRLSAPSDIAAPQKRFALWMRDPPAATTGLVPVVHCLPKMDCRDQPGNDDEIYIDP